MRQAEHTATPARSDSVPGTVLAVDLGKTSCRIRIGTTRTDGPGAPGLAERDGMNRALDAIDACLGQMGTNALTPMTALGIGLAGASSAPDRSLSLAHALRQRLGVPVALTSDVVTAHLGALGGGPGTVLIAGTGAVAIAVGRDGDLRRSDGWGTWLGDEGSGRWIGQRGLAAVLRAVDGRGPRTSLHDAATTRWGDLRRLPSLIGGDESPERALASFAPSVLAEAATGDAVALVVVDEAVERLGSAVAAASRFDPASPVVLLGGLTEDAAFRARLETCVTGSGLRVIPAGGDALDGAALLAHRTDLPHERQTTRV